MSNDKLREALERIEKAGEPQSCWPGHYNGAEHLRCMSCGYRWAKNIEPEQHSKDCPAQIAREALAASKQEPHPPSRLCMCDDCKPSFEDEPQAQAGEPEVVKKVCYSWNDEEYNCDSFGDLLDSADDPKVGDTYYEADCVTLEPTAGINSWTVDSLLEGMDERIYEDIGECYDNECSDVSDEAKAELRALIENWAQKHINLSRYWKIVGKRREMKLTEDDLK